MMCDLPPGRLAVNQAAFTHMGVNFYSSFAISQGHSCNTTAKVWGVIFTCLSTRAVYLNVAASLSMAHCLNVIKIFLATYGDKTRCLYSDNGISFKGTDNAIRRMYTLIDKQKYQWHLLTDESHGISIRHLLAPRWCM